jgi:ATP-dependent exoDNAse (exonuclease V) alpha subunit
VNDHESPFVVRGSARRSPARRAFAEGDDVLAVRNDYRLGLLNGCHATVDRVDVDRGHIVAATDNDQRLVIPSADMKLPSGR